MQRQRSQSSSSFSSTPYTRKRTHLKPSQVAVLQESFVTNALPDAAMRSHLARELEVSERTIQIWFQNRRAKARKSEAYSLGQDMSSLVPNVRTGWIEPPLLSKNINASTAATTSSAYQDTLRALITPESYVGNFKPRHTFHPFGFDQQQRLRSFSSMPEKQPIFSSFGLPTRAMSEGTDRQVIQLPIPVNALRIGTWARFMSLTPQNEWDLVCYCHPLERMMVWQVEDGGHKFRIELDFDQINQMRLTQVPLNATTTVGQLEVDVSLQQQIRFCMRQSSVDDWVRCGDFSENKQASIETMHVLQGNYDALKHALVDIVNMVAEFSHKLVLPPPSLDVSSHGNGGYDDLSVSPCSTPEPAPSSTASTNMMMVMMAGMNDPSPQQQQQHHHQHHTKKEMLDLASAMSTTPSSLMPVPPPPPPPFEQMQQYYMQLFQHQQQQEQHTPSSVFM
ncbi:hypothetical protein BC941DRAFT_423439 [Chlamydoabsidia padenii]|nr:hypothetical protein BC941DRAFT_423439 [Chlamydoabsidia padenii]